MIDNQINIGQFVAAEIVVILIMTSVEKLILSMETIYDVLTALEKIGTVTDLPLDSDDGVYFEKRPGFPGMEVSLKNLTFQYQEEKEPLLHGLDLHIKPGEKLCNKWV